MDKIICLIGKSGSGKTTVAMKLEDLGYNVIQSYTTRPPRYEGEWGHIFIGQKGIIAKRLNERFRSIWTEESGLIKRDDMLAYREMYGYDYFATNEQYIDKGTSIYIVDPKSALEIRENHSNAYILQLDISDEVRSERMLTEGRCEEDIKVRLEKDKNYFGDMVSDFKVNADKDLDTIINKILEVI